MKNQQFNQFCVGKFLKIHEIEVYSTGMDLKSPTLESSLT